MHRFHPRMKTSALVASTSKTLTAAITITIAIAAAAALADNKRPSRFEQDLKRSTDTIQAQKIERTKLSLDQAEKRALEFSDEAARHCADIKEAETAAIGNGRGPIFPFRAFRSANSTEIEEAKKPYEEEIKDVQTETRRKIKEILEEGQEAVESIEQSAAHVHKGIHEFTPDKVRTLKSN
ncbi:hypothetical protein BH10CYA1_BH10CYA1_02120 [soil metagenome]